MFDAGGYFYVFDFRNHVGQPITFLYSFIIFLLTTLLCFKISKSLIISALIGIFKSLIFCIYFYFYYSADYHFYDDVVYFVISKEQFEAIGPIKIFFNISNAQSLIGTNHIAYWIYVYLSGILFGFYYFSAVFCNIILSLLSSYILYLTLIRLNFSKIFCSLFFLFTVIHWETIAWTSFVSSKEPLVYFTIVLTFYNLVLIKVNKKINIINLIYISFALIIVSQIRTYILIFLLVIFSFYAIFLIKLPKQKIYRLLLFLTPTIIIPTFVYINFEAIYFSLNFAYISITNNQSIDYANIPYGIAKFLLTPNPLNISSNYGFYYLPAFLHILFIPFVLLGSVMMLKRENLPLICYLILFITIVIFYSMFPEIQGARQRYQISMVIIFMQFLPLYKFFVQRKIYS